MPTDRTALLAAGAGVGSFLVGRLLLRPAGAGTDAVPDTGMAADQGDETSASLEFPGVLEGVYPMTDQFGNPVSGTSGGGLPGGGAVALPPASSTQPTTTYPAPAPTPTDVKLAPTAPTGTGTIKQAPTLGTSSPTTPPTSTTTTPATKPLIRWWPSWLPTPPTTATFAAVASPGTYWRVDSNGVHVTSFKTGGFSAYGNSIKTVGGRQIGKLISGAYAGWWIVLSAYRIYPRK